MVSSNQFNRIVDELKQSMPENIEYNDTPISLNELTMIKKNKEVYLSTLNNNFSTDLIENCDIIYGIENIFNLTSEELDELLKIEDDEEFLELL